MSAMSELDAAVNVAGLYSAQFSRQAETISELRDALAQAHELCLEQANTIAQLRVEIHLLRKRAGLTPEIAARMLGAAMETRP